MNCGKAFGVVLEQASCGVTRELFMESTVDGKEMARMCAALNNNPVRG
jgi:hypothetical protein